MSALSNSEVAGLGQHVKFYPQDSTRSPRGMSAVRTRFIEGMNQSLVLVLGLLQPQKDLRHERNEGRENRDHREAERIV